MVEHSALDLMVTGSNPAKICKFLLFHGHGKQLKEVQWTIEVMGLHGTLLEEVPWPIEGMGLHGTHLEGVPWPI